MSEKKTFYRRVLPDDCVAFASEKGKQLFKGALATGHMNCYFPLASQFRTQEEPAYCGLSSLVMVLNALAIDPGVVWKGVFRWYHEDMLDCCLPLEEVKAKGVSMDNLMCLAICNQLEGELKRVTDGANINQFREEVKFATTREDRAIIVSYGRRSLQQTGSGHFSPIGGYNVDEDMVLIMDVARFKYPPYWVTLTQIWNAMKTLDEDTGLNRGYMILWRADSGNMPSQPPMLFKVSQRLNASRSILRESGKFLLKMKSFLLGNTKETTDDEILKSILTTFMKESVVHSKDSGGEDVPSFLTLRITEKQIRTSFPEQAEVVQQLIQAINETELCQKISKIFPNGICCEQGLFNTTDDSTTEVICLGGDAKGTDEQCFICLQHFLTVFLLSFPMDTVTCCHCCQNKTVLKTTYEQECAEGTYYSFLKKLINNEVGVDNCSNCKNSNQIERQRRSLLVNEITQLRRQFIVLMKMSDS